MFLRHIFIAAALWLSVFSYTTHAAEYVGCFEDKRDRALPIYSNDGDSVDKCQKYCREHTLNTYFGLETGHQCYCGEEYGRYGQTFEFQCDRVCRSDAAHKCGGAWRLSVYYVCPRGHFGQSCSEQCHCKDGEFCSRRGTCLNKLCEEGWMDRTCSVDVDECSTEQNDCDQRCHNTNGNYYCSCRAGFEASNGGKNCTDINECTKDNGGCSHTCKNVVGSYFCSCPSNLTLRADQHTCIYDINECKTNNGGCSHYCNNVLESYFCACPKDHNLSTDLHTCIQDPSMSGSKIAIIVLGCLLACVILAVLLRIARKRFRNHPTPIYTVPNRSPLQEIQPSVKYTAQHTTNKLNQTRGVQGRRQPFQSGVVYIFNDHAVYVDKAPY